MNNRGMRGAISSFVCFVMVMCTICTMTGCKQSGEENQTGNRDKISVNENQETDVNSDIDAQMQKTVFEDGNYEQIGTYVETLDHNVIDAIEYDGNIVKMVQLFWKCEGGSGEAYGSAFDGTEWVVNVYMNGDTMLGYDVLPCAYNVYKTAKGNAVLMEKDEDAITMAYSTYMDSSYQALYSVEEFKNQWNTLTEGIGAFKEIGFYYYGYNESYSYPFVTVMWKHENRNIYYTYCFAAGSTKVIGVKSGVYTQTSMLAYEEVTSEKKNTQTIEKTYSLKDIYKDYFSVGVAVPSRVISNPTKYSNIITANFNSMTCENDMKPDAVLNLTYMKQGVVNDPTFVSLNYSSCQSTIAYCEANGIKMRLHTFVWHQQTPEWFFHVDYDTTKDYVDRDTMIGRMQSLIYSEINYFDTNYPDLIYAIDVVNEAFNGNGNYNITDKNNGWYNTIGYDYPYYAFLFAKKAIGASQNMQDVALVYNDYGMPNKVDRVMNGLSSIFHEHNEDVHAYIDTIGFQAHYDTNTSMASVAKAVKSFSDDGYKIQITELDIGIPGIAIGGTPTEEQLVLQGEKYRSLMERLVALEQSGVDITNVTVWGISDDLSWRQRTDGYDAYALMLNSDLSYKPAFLGMALDNSIMSYYKIGLTY